MIPEFDINGNLPPGIHQVTWEEFTKRFGITRHRCKLLGGLKRALDSLKAAGCQTVYVDGSFITEKKVPGDFDACWDINGVNLIYWIPFCLLLQIGVPLRKPSILESYSLCKPQQKTSLEEHS
jgi:hypothetical protein